MEKMRLKGAEYGLKADELRIKFEELRIKLAQEKSTEAKAADYEIKDREITDPQGNKHVVTIRIPKKPGGVPEIIKLDGQPFRTPVKVKEPTPLGEMDKFHQQKSLAAAKGVVETLTIDGESIKPEQASGYVDLFNAWSPEPYVYRIIPDPHLYGTRWARDPGKKIQRFDLPRLADGTQITAKMLYEVATKTFRTTPDEYLDRMYKNGRLTPGTWPPKDWPGIVSAAPPVAKSSPPGPPLPIQ